MAFLFTLTHQTKRGLVTLFIAVSSLTNLTAQNYTATKAVTSASLKQKMQRVYGGYRFTLNIPLSKYTYHYYKKQSKRNSYASYVQEHKTYRYLNLLAKQLKIDADRLGYSGWKLAEYLTAFVQQNITYTRASYNSGFNYPKYPIEILVEKKETAKVLLFFWRHY